MSKAPSARPVHPHLGDGVREMEFRSGRVHERLNDSVGCNSCRGPEHADVRPSTARPSANGQRGSAPDDDADLCLMPAMTIRTPITAAATLRRQIASGTPARDVTTRPMINPGSGANRRPTSDMRVRDKSCSLVAGEG